MSADQIILELAEKQAIFKLMAALCPTASTPRPCRRGGMLRR